MWWKIYFFILVAVTFLGILQYPRYLPFALGDWRMLAENVILILGVYSYAFKKKILPKQVFLWFLLVILILWPMDIVGIFLGNETPDPFGSLFDNSIPSTNIGGRLIVSIIGLPSVYAIYRYIKLK